MIININDQEVKNCIHLMTAIRANGNEFEDCRPEDTVVEITWNNHSVTAKGEMDGEIFTFAQGQVMNAIARYFQEYHCFAEISSIQIMYDPIFGFSATMETG